MVTVRYKKLKSEKYSAYLDVYSNAGPDKGKRNYEFLKIYVSKDYSSVEKADWDKLFIDLVPTTKN